MAAVRSGDIIAGKYRVERVLGTGGMGVVVAARHIDLGWLRAVKVMHPQPEEVAAWAPRLRREAQVGSKLSSEHAVRVFEVGGFDEGQPYLVMEHLEGQELAKVLRKRGPLPVSEAALYVAQACDAIAEAHDLGVVHRDLKPANLFLTTRADGSACIKVLDFGISKAGLNDEALSVTQTGEVIGSPAYMAPEQIRSFRDVGPRSDVWALGVILYELVTRRYPFPGRSSVEMLALVLEREAEPPSKHRADLPPGFEAVLLHCLQKDPARRMPSVLALREALAPYLPVPQAGPADDELPTIALGEDAPTLAMPSRVRPKLPTDDPDEVATIAMQLRPPAVQTTAPLPAASLPSAARAPSGPSTRVVLMVAAASLAVLVIALTALVRGAMPTSAEVAATSSAEAVASSATAVTSKSDAVAPSSEPVAPSSEPVTPSSEPVAPSSEPVAPSSEPVAPSSEPAAPSTPSATESAAPVAVASGARTAGTAAPAASASAKADAPPSGPVSKQIDQGAAIGALNAAAGAARKCKKPGGPTGLARVEVTFGSSGKVTSARVGAPFSGTPVGKCIVSAFRSASVPPFEGSSFEAAKTLSIK